MKNAFLITAILGLVCGQVSACHKCGRSHAVNYGSPPYAGAASVPLLYSVPMTTYSAPLTYSVPLSASVPAYYPAYPTTLSDAQTQGLINDMVFGIGGGFVKPVGCQFCRSMGCCNDQGNSPADPVKNLKETIREIGDLIRSVKDLEKDIKDAVDGQLTAAEHDATRGNPQITQLLQIRDEIRQLNQTDRSTRIAQAKE